MDRLINWIEISVSDFQRAINFYETILNVNLQKMEMGNAKYALFPTKDNHNSGALVQSENHTPASKGTIPYLDGGIDLDIILRKVIDAGGEVLMPKTYFGEEAGYTGLFLDSEGNRIGLQNF
ncbi:VOC family protein [Leptospira bouyouniensis]|uniref:VOC family protein n=1 Tax=Leptospira bouyouniensis TaxID=2484911 RepID=A0A7I0HPS3_9LEPT|nr:VOC family protein [Leptospira bouyouniensis]TGL04068.1 VOC family protein [Leptospira bouyouniensis]